MREGVAGGDGKSRGGTSCREEQQRETLRTGWKNERSSCLSVSVFFLKQAVWALSASAETASLLCFPPGVTSRSHGHRLLPAHACSAADRTERREHPAASSPPKFLRATSCLASGPLQDNLLVTLSKYSSIFTVTEYIQ